MINAVKRIYGMEIVKKRNHSLQEPEYQLKLEVLRMRKNGCQSKAHIATTTGCSMMMVNRILEQAGMK